MINIKIICILVCVLILYKIIYKHRYKLAIMAIFKEEHNYMQEWLDHHINQGISHFYLYNNDPNIEKYPYLLDGKYKKYVTLIEWINIDNKTQTVQKQAYSDCVKNYHKEYDYIMALDLDEFIFTTNGYKVIDIINSINKCDVKAFKIPRYNYGSNGHLVKPKGNVVNNYRMREKTCSSYKTIANSECIDINKNFFGVHDFNLIDGSGKIYNEIFNYKYTGVPNKCPINFVNEIPLVINHYYTKSKEEYLKRCELWKTGGVNRIGVRKNCENNFNKVDVNEIYD